MVHGHTSRRKPRKTNACTLVESLQTGLAGAGTAPIGDEGMPMLGPVTALAAQVPVHSLRDRDQLINIGPCDVVAKGVIASQGWYAQ